jgi:choline dehydrogenase-like flavoprotein
VASIFEVRDALRRGELPETPYRHLRNVATGVHRLLQAGARMALRSHDREPRYVIRAVVEPVPDPSSRVTLSRERDVLGLPRVRLEWRLGELERMSLESLHRILREEVDRARLGQVELSLSDTWTGWPATLSGGGHHIGTTRMNRDPKQGVVDEHGRVHGVSNLFVAGSSVFPTAGYANPTLTLLALTLRLADHLKGRLTSRARVQDRSRSS